MTIEENLARLDEIISKLDNKDTSLEDAFKEYESGIKLVKECNDAIDKVEKDLPIIFLAGNDDPVGNYGKGVTKAYETFKSKGVKDVSIKLYPTDRHEILNELDKEQVYEDVYEFIDKHI